MGKKKSSRVGVMLLITLLIVFFVGVSGVLAVKLPNQLSELNQIKESMAGLEANKASMQEVLDGTKNVIETLEGQLKDIEGRLDKARLDNPDMAESLENASAKYAYLTFDDGPSKNTIKILDFLKANNIKATFFVLGVEGQEDVYKRIVDEGHTIALHTNTHKYDEIYVNVDTFMEDINTLSNTIEEATGVVSDVLRFPGGSNNTISYKYGGKDLMDKIIKETNSKGLVYFDWNVDSMDASANKQSKDVIVKSVLDGAKGKNSAIILMHDAAVKTTTVDALPEIVEGLRAQGFSFDKITSDTKPIQFKK